MNLLLDTHVLIWWDEGRRLAADARRAIEKADTVYVSAASAWEVAIKVGMGRLRPTRTVEQAVAQIRDFWSFRSRSGMPSEWPRFPRTIEIPSTGS